MSSNMALKSAEEDLMLQQFIKHFQEFNYNSTDDYDVRTQRETGMPAPKMDPFVTRLQHREAYQKVCENRKSNVIYPFMTTVINKAEFSVAPLDTLVPTRICDLRVNVPAKGFYLIARTIEQPIVEVGLRTVIEDYTGDVFIFSVYNMFDYDLSYKPEDIFPLGTVFALKEPLLKTSYGGTQIIRCDSPTDIIFIDASHQLFEKVRGISWKNEIEEPVTLCKPTTCEEWKNLGNEYFQKNGYRKALEAYFIALKQSETASDKMLTILNSNIAAVYLKMESFESALFYSSKALDLNPHQLKAHYRSGRARYELRQYEEASHHFKMAIKLDPSNIECAEELAKCVSRLDEQKGKVDIYKLLLTKTYKPRTEIDCADFMGPIEVVDVPKKGRGVVAKEDINPGTLLCVSKALCVSFTNPLEGVTVEKTEYGHFSANRKLVAKVAQSVMNNPTTFGRLVYDLSGNDSRTWEKLFCDEKTGNGAIVHIDRIRNILDTNCFSLATRFMGPDSGTGLFQMPSYFNHSCVCNAVWEPYNNILVIHAAKDISRGEEIVISYHDPLELYCDRQPKISMRNFICCCLLCELDRSEEYEIHLQRLKLFTRQNEFENEQGTSRVSALNHLISDIERTFRKSGRTRFHCCLYHLYLHRSLALQKVGLLEQSRTDIEKALSTVGLSTKNLLLLVDQDKPLPKYCLVINKLCLAIELLAVCCSKCGNAQETRKWIKVLLAIEKMCSGGDMNVAKVKYKNLSYMLDEINGI